MACVTADEKLNESALKILRAAKQPMTLGDIAISTNLPF